MLVTTLWGGTPRQSTQRYFLVRGAAVPSHYAAKAFFVPKVPALLRYWGHRAAATKIAKAKGQGYFRFRGAVRSAPITAAQRRGANENSFFNKSIMQFFESCCSSCYCYRVELLLLLACTAHNIYKKRW